MPPPSAAKPFSKSSKTITKRIETIAKKSMADAVTEIRNSKNAEDNNVINCRWNLAETWLFLTE